MLTATISYRSDSQSTVNLPTHLYSETAVLVVHNDVFRTVNKGHVIVALVLLDRQLIQLIIPLYYTVLPYSARRIDPQGSLEGPESGPHILANSVV